MWTPTSRRRIAKAAAALAAVGAPWAATAPAARAQPFAGRAMWVYEVPRTAGGSPERLGAQARALGIQTLIVKAANGPALWAQFSVPYVAALKAQGLRVCAYQRLLGRRPIAEARTAAQAIRAGADCFVIDAEAELEGRYAQARRYVATLRAAVGSDFPVALTSFPYNDVHPDFPYSVFLAPGAATASLPQIYWKDIGDTVDRSVARTYADNAVYGAPIEPVGQLYGRPKPAEIARLRRLAARHGAQGMSWWVWQQARPEGFAAVGRAGPPPATTPPVEAYPSLKIGSRGDVVRWAKDHLASLGHPADPGPRFTARTARAVGAAQADALLAQTGAVDAATWRVLVPGLR